MKVGRRHKKPHVSMKNGLPILAGSPFLSFSKTELYY